MRDISKSMRTIVELALLLALVIGLVAVIQSFLGGEPASPPAEESLDYPPPASEEEPIDATDLPYVPPPPPLMEGDVNPTVIDIGDDLLGEEPLPTLTLFPTSTLRPTPTRRPGPTPTAMPLKAPASSPAGLIWYNTEERIPNPDPNLADFPTIVYSNVAIAINASGDVTPAANLNNLMTGLDVAWNHRIWATYPSGDNRYFVLMAASEPGGNPIVYDTLAGETRIPLPSNEYPAGNFLDWHPDNRHFLFYASFSGLYLVDAETLEITKLALDVHLQGGAISPDGLTVAFIVDGDPSDSLWLTSIVGGDAEPVFNTGSTSYLHIGAWSPDGMRLVYYGRCREDISGDNPQKSPICIYDLTTGKRNEAHIPSLTAGVISWSPDGRYIAAGGYTVNTCDQEGLSQIESEACQYDKPVADLPKQQINRGRLIYIEDTLNGDVREMVSGYAPVWSPDGSMIAFLSNRSGTEEVWLIRSDGTDLEQLTADGRMKAWSIIWTQESEQ